MAYEIIQNQTINWLGAINIKGIAAGTYGPHADQPDYSQWSVAVYLFDQSGENLIYQFQVTNLSNVALPNTNGLYTVNAPKSDTNQFPIGKAQLLVQYTTADGAVIPSKPTWYRIVASPIAKLQQ